MNMAIKEYKVKTVQSHNGHDVRNMTIFCGEQQLDAALHHVRKCVTDESFKKVVLEYTK